MKNYTKEELKELNNTVFTNDDLDKLMKHPKEELVHMYKCALGNKRKPNDYFERLAKLILLAKTKLDEKDLIDKE